MRWHTGGTISNHNWDKWEGVVYNILYRYYTKLVATITLFILLYLLRVCHTSIHKPQQITICWSSLAVFWLEDLPQNYVFHGIVQRGGFKSTPHVVVHRLMHVYFDRRFHEKTRIRCTLQDIFKTNDGISYLDDCWCKLLTVLLTILYIYMGYKDGDTGG